MRVAVAVLIALTSVASASWCNCCPHTESSPCTGDDGGSVIADTSLVNLGMTTGSPTIRTVSNGVVVQSFANTTSSASGYNGAVKLVLDNSIASPSMPAYVYALQHQHEMCFMRTANGYTTMQVLMYISADYAFTNGGQAGTHSACILVTLRADCRDAAYNLYDFDPITNDVLLTTADACVASDGFTEQPHVGGMLAHYVRPPPLTEFSWADSNWQQQCLAEWTYHVTETTVNGTVDIVIPRWETDQTKPRTFASAADHDRCLDGSHPAVVHGNGPAITTTALTADGIVADILAAYGSSFPRAQASHAKIIEYTSDDDYVIDITLQYAAVSQRSPRAVLRLVLIGLNQSGTLTLYPVNATTFAAYSQLHTADTSYSLFQERACTYTNVTVPCPPHVETPHSVYAGAWPNITVFSIGNTSQPCPLPDFSPCAVTPTGPCDSNSSYTTDILERATYMVLPVSLPVVAVVVLAVLAVCGGVAAKAVLPTVRRVPMRSGKPATYTPVTSNDQDVPPPAYTPSAVRQNAPAYVPPAAPVYASPESTYAPPSAMRKQPPVRLASVRQQQQQQTYEPEDYYGNADEYDVPRAYGTALKKRSGRTVARPDNWQTMPLLPTGASAQQ